MSADSGHVDEKQRAARLRVVVLLEDALAALAAMAGQVRPSLLPRSLSHSWCLRPYCSPAWHETPNRSATSVTGTGTGLNFKHRPGTAALSWSTPPALGECHSGPDTDRSRRS